MDKAINVYMISDSSGETVEMVLQAAINQFHSLKVQEHLYTMVRSCAKIDELLNRVQQCGGVVLYTMAYNDIRAYLVNRCYELGITCICPLESVVQTLKEAVSGSDTIGLRKAPGKYLTLDELYYAKVQSLYFTLHHDDGCNIQTVTEADIILLGVSRTSKTPISLYLAHRGYKVANIPIIPHSDEDFLRELVSQAQQKPKIIGLILGASYLTKLRESRYDKMYGSTIRSDNLVNLNQEQVSRQDLIGLKIDTYTDNNAIYHEMYYARALFRDLGIMTIDVTRKAIEEIAAEIVSLITKD